MKPVLVLQHLVNDGPAYLDTWLRRQGVPVELRCTEAGQAFPDRLDGYSALALLGGSMSANDDLPSLRQAETLILQAMALDVPMIGHCLGGQLMARALGAEVTESPAPEVGWSPIQVLGGSTARTWFGGAPSPTVFQWHYEAFDLPEGAEPLAGNDAAPNQAFAIGPHLAMQFHIEVDEAKLSIWLEHLDAGYAPALQSHPASVQSVQAMRDGVAQHLAAHQVMADRIYRRWLSRAQR